MEIKFTDAGNYGLDGKIGMHLSLGASIPAGLILIIQAYPGALSSCERTGFIGDPPQALTGA